ncbi:hypothetical protein JJJ17_00140 [Paracoccus caeni]|uniref:Type III secretion system protein n=1 Tax=Paracoccus caeni TaxID=657651 RepID=A0A934VYJ9_9RHOB|nr:hypothetical protein [Paracoccus caeni]MBK4214323.1 hypothetical protein [Paracoccus caeni]
MSKAAERDRAAPGPSRIPAQDVARARMRARASAARVSLRRPGLDPQGRGGARKAQDLSPIGEADLPETLPAVQLMLAGKRAELVLDAAVAALLSPLLSDVIASKDVAALPIQREAREFGLRHRHLAMTLEEIPATDPFAAVKAGLRGLWVTMLPPVLGREWETATEPLHLPPVVVTRHSAPSPRFGGLSGWLKRRRPKHILPLAVETPVEDRAEAALLGAIRELCGEM